MSGHCPTCFESVGPGVDNCTCPPGQKALWKAIAERDAARAEVDVLKGQASGHARLIQAAKATSKAFKPVRYGVPDVCGLRELREALIAAGVEMGE